MRKRVDSRTGDKPRTYPLITQTIERSNSDEFVFDMIIRILCSKHSPSSILPKEKCKNLLSDPAKIQQFTTIAHRKLENGYDMYADGIFVYLGGL